MSQGTFYVTQETAFLALVLGLVAGAVAGVVLSALWRGRKRKRARA